MPQISVNDLKNGITLELDNGLFQVVEFQHVKPGKGGAFVRTKIRNVRNGAVIDKTFNAGIKVEQAIVDRQDMQFLYKDGDDYVFMNTSTYDQMNVPQAALGDAADYLTEQMIAQIAIYQGEIIGVEIAASVELHHRPDRAGRAGRPRVRRPQAGDARDRQGDPGAAVRRDRRQGQGRHPHRRLHHPRLIAADPMPSLPRPDERSDARERALYLLYEAHSKGIAPADALALQVLEPDALTTELVAGVGEHRERLDAAIAARAKGWTLERMPVIDLNVLRIASFELAERPDVPGGRRARRGGRAGQAVLHRRQRSLRERRAVGAGRRPANIVRDVRVAPSRMSAGVRPRRTFSTNRSDADDAVAGSERTVVAASDA